MDGTIDRSLGRGYAGRGYYWFQRSNLVRPSRQLPQRSPPRDRAIHTQEPGRPRLPGDDRGSEGVYTPLEDSNASLPQTGPERAVDGVQVRRVRRGADVRTFAQENGRRETVRSRAHAVAVACASKMARSWCGVKSFICGVRDSVSFRRAVPFPRDSTSTKIALAGLC